MDNSTPIYDISKTCDHLFNGILSKPDTASALVAEVLYQKFKQWTSYLRVFAPQNISLDTRLKYSESVNQLVLKFLQIASRNLHRSEPSQCISFTPEKETDLWQSASLMKF
jgi:hypothetical protein